MEKNIGSLDRVIRIVLAVVIIALYFSHLISGITTIILLVIAGILILTSSVSFCPLYFPFGISTRKKKP